MIFDVLVVLVACAAIGGVARRADGRVSDATKRMEDATAAREAALNQQAKVFVRRLEQSRRVGAEALDRARVLADNAEQHQQIAQQMLQEVKRGRQH